MDQPPRPPATLPPLAEDVDSLIARNAPIARTRKRRSENFERCTTATTDDNLLEQLQDAGARLRQRGRERDDARRERDAACTEVATLRRERDEALRERDAARKQLAARNDMLAQVLKEQQY